LVLDTACARRSERPQCRELLPFKTPDRSELRNAKSKSAVGGGRQKKKGIPKFARARCSTPLARGADGLRHSHVKLRLTKSIHCVCRARQVARADTVVMTEGKGASSFAIPWASVPYSVLTDTDYSGSLDHVIAEASDIRYVLQVTNQFFPSAKLSERD